MSHRLLYFVNIPRFFVTHRLPLALAARDAGYDVHIATSNDTDEYAVQIHATGIPYHPLPLRQHGIAPHHELETLRAVIRLYRQLKPDLVHQVTVKAILYGGMAARVTRVPAVVNAVSGAGAIFVGRGVKTAAIRAGVEAAYRLVLRHPNSRTIFQNPDDCDLFVRRGLLDAEQAIIIKGSGVDMQAFSPQPEPEGVPVVLYAGRLMWQKGIGEFVDAAQRLKARGVAARFVVAGLIEPTNPAVVPLEKLEAWHDQGVIEWWGSRRDMPDVFAQSHIVCLPSTYGEGVPKVLIEAAACGRAIVTTDTPGCREIVQHGENGLLVPVKDVEALSAALAELIADPLRRQQMGLHGRQLAEREFSLEHVNRATLEVYRTLLANVPPRNPD